MIPEQRLREIATKAWALDDRIDPPNWLECQPLAAELLAARAELATVRAERDRYHDALVARHGGEPVALLSELDAARADAESARREGQEIAAGLHEKLAELRAENGAQLAAGKALYEATQKLMAENERLAKQMTAMDRKRQALAEACVEAAEWLARRASMPSCECDPSDLAKRMLAAIAEQPKPAGGGA